MEREQNIEIAMAYNRIVRPWTEKGLEPPAVSVKELTREAGLKNPTALANKLANSGIIFDANGGLDSRLRLEDNRGFKVNDIERIAKEMAPYKRAVRESDYRSRAPGGGPVVKRRINGNSLGRKLVDLGTSRLKVGVEAYDGDAERLRERQETKRRLVERWGVRMKGVEPSGLEAERVLNLMRDISERRGLANEKEMLRRIKDNIETNNPQIILALWGPPYEEQGMADVFLGQTPEENMAGEILAVAEKLREVMPTNLVILYADCYGTVINGIPENEVLNYGNQLRERFSGQAEFISWFALKEENLLEYSNIRDNLPNDVIIPGEEEISKAIMIQAKLGSRVTTTQAANIAERYRRERLVEGMMLNRGFLWQGESYDNIIKLGTAPSRFNNDEPYEKELPRFYVSGMPRAAWNTPR